MQSIFQRGVRKARKIVSRQLRPLRRPLKAAVIGCGGIAARHIGSYEDIGIAQVVSVADVSPGALAKALDWWPFVRAYRDYRQMLAEIKPDVVSVCTWPQLHAQMVCDAARAGVKGILCEKPIALRLDDIEEMVNVCRSHGTKFAVGHQWRFHPVFNKAADLIRSGSLGRIQRVEGVIRGSIANNGPHLIDAVRCILGDPNPIRVSCQCVREHDTVERGLPCEETAVSSIQFEGGIECVLETGAADKSAFLIQVQGTQGNLEATPETLTINDQCQRFSRQAAAEKGRLRQFREFVEWVKGKRPAYGCDHEPASVAAELVLALYESARTGGPISLPLENKGDVIAQVYPSTQEQESANQQEATGGGCVSDASAPASDRLAMDGGRRAMRSSFVNQPSLGLPELKNLTSVILSKRLNCKGGQMVSGFERQFAKLYGSPCAVASTSGTAAIHVALATLNPDPCDEIITTPLSDMGTVIPILACNGIPVFADVDPDTGNLTAETIRSKITPRTRAVILVHLFGRPAEMTPIVELLRERDIALIEDCAQAHLAEYAGKKVGTFGDLGCFSLQQSKQITCGDGGITLVNRPELAERAQLFIDKGWARGQGARAHLFLGMNYRMTELQGAVALAQLGKVSRLVKARRDTARQLTELLSRIPGVVLPPGNPDVHDSCWKFILSIDEKRLGLSVDEFCDALCVEGVKAGTGYLPRPLFEEDMIRYQHTYGDSRYPFSAVDYVPPDVADYPGFQEFNRRWILVSWSSRVRRSHVRSIAEAVRKVTAAVRPRKPAGADEHERLELATQTG